MQTNARAFVLLAALNVVVVLMAPAAAANGQERKPTSTELKAKLIDVIELLETDPYNKDADATQLSEKAAAIAAPGLPT